MKKAAMWTFAILMICTLMTGCGSSASKFAGSYTGAVDMTDVYRQEFEDFTGVSSEASCSVDVTITLTEENKETSFTMSADPGTIRQAISDEIDSRAEEVFNAIMTSMAFYEKDIRKIICDAVELIPADSEYGQVIRFALEQCRNHDNYLDAWRPCESRYDHYNWIHAYPNACAEIVALWYGDSDFTKTLTTCGMCGQDADCNAAQLITIVGIVNGLDFIPEYWVKPIGDNLDTYVRGLKHIKISELAKWTAEVARKLV